MQRRDTRKGAGGKRENTTNFFFRCIIPRRVRSEMIVILMVMCLTLACLDRSPLIFVMFIALCAAIVACTPHQEQSVGSSQSETMDEAAAEPAAEVARAPSEDAFATFRNRSFPTRTYHHSRDIFLQMYASDLKPDPNVVLLQEEPSASSTSVPSS